MTEQRKKLIDRFQRWLDTEPRAEITAAQCATIAEEYHKEQLAISRVGISSFIDQTKAELIGYQAFYKDGSNKFYKSIFDIQNNIVSNPLVDVKQVGKSY